jgi:ComF family protein
VSGARHAPAVTAILRPIDRLLDLALPAACPGCGAEGPPLCPACLPAVNSRLAIPAGSALGLADGPPEPLLQLEWCSPFAGTTRRALHALKYGGERRLAEPLGAAVAARWRMTSGGGDLIVPIPVHARRRRERGFDQAELIAAAASRGLGLPWLAALERRRATAPQFNLDRRHRAANVADAFAIRPGAARAVCGRWVVLVDDIVTTGATLSAAAWALLDAGALAVSAVTVARER